MWEDGIYLTSQSDDMDTSPGAGLNTSMWMTAMQIAISSKLNTWNTWFAGNRIWCGLSIPWVLTDGDLLAEQGREFTDQISTVTSKTWLYLSFAKQLPIY